MAQGPEEEPAEGSAEEPAEGSAEKPAEGSEQAPPKDSVTVPVEDSEQAPQRESVTVPVEDSKRAPTRDSTRSKRESVTSLNKAFEERRKYEGGDDGEGEGEEERDPTQITSKELKKRARVHMLSKACTKWDDKEKRYKFWSVLKTSRRQLGVLGFGVQLYFQFLCQMGGVFLFLTLITLPLLLTNLAGDMVSSEGTQQAFGMMSIANLGCCGPSGVLCSSASRLLDRKAGFRFSFLGLSPDTKVRDLTPIFGTLDGVALLVFMSYGLFLTKVWIPRERKVFDGEHVTPEDFTLRVCYLPRRLDEAEHKDYEALLKEHFAKLLKDRCGIQDDAPVHDVVCVRYHDGAIDDYVAQGQYLLQRDDLKVRKSKATEDEKVTKKLQKQIDALNTTLVKMERSFGSSLGKTDEERDVIREAFVTFDRSSYTEKVMHEYRFARSKIFRCCLEESLKFRGHNIAVFAPGEPSDLFWDNMDISKWARRGRIATTCVMTLIILVFCLIVLLYSKMIGAETLATPLQNDLWVIRSAQSSDCLTLCDWTHFSDRSCRSQAGLGSIVSFWDHKGNHSAVNHTVQDCSSGFWSSRSCNATTNAITNAGQAQAQWIGVQFSAAVNPACMQFKQLAASALPAVEVYVCSASGLANLSSAELATWNPDAHCIGMQDLTPATTAMGLWSSSGAQPVLTDTSCRRTISAEAAQEAKDCKIKELQAADTGLSHPDAHYLASSTAHTVDCYCLQQQAIEGYASFRAPPYDSTPAKILCSDWIWYKNTQLAMMTVGVIVISIVNLVLVLIFSYFAIWERHRTFTSQNVSQFVKLFIAQFMNTALIVLLVNANFRQSTKDVWIVEALGLGKGTYDDFDGRWFVAIGSGLCLTIALQVFSTTTSGHVMTYIVNPIMIWFFRKGVSTQKAINQIYVFPEWSLANRLAQTMTVITVIFMYSGGMPILNVVGLVYCIVAYWLDKWCLLRGSFKPPAYDGSLIKLAANMFPVAAFLHVIVTLWCFGNQNNFPAEWSVLQQPFGRLINMDEQRYSDITTSFFASTEDQRNSIFFDYLHARTLDFARWSCWLLLCIFLVFCVYYILTFLNALFLRPILAPVYIYIGGKCSDGAKVRLEDSHKFEELHQDMVDRGILPSYSVYDNPRYSVVLAHLQDGANVVEAAKAELEVSKAAELAEKEAAAKATQAAKEKAMGANQV